MLSLLCLQLEFWVIINLYLIHVYMYMYPRTLDLISKPVIQVLGLWVRL